MKFRYIGLLILTFFIFVALCLLPPEIKSVGFSAAKPEFLKLYFKQPAMRDLLNLIAANRIQAFRTVWDTSQGVLLSKKMFRPISMDGQMRYGYLPNLKKLSFQTGFGDFKRKFEAPDSPRLRDILSRLETSWQTESSFDENGFRRTGYEEDAQCSSTTFFAGDSFTEGLWVKDGEVFPVQYAALLNQNSAERNCVVNSGTNGYGAFEASFIARQYFQKRPYQTLFLIHYPNDIHFDALAVLQGTLPEIETYWREHFKILSQLVEFTKQNQIRLILVPIPPKEQFALVETQAVYQERLAIFSKEQGIEFWDPFEMLRSHTWEEIYLDWDPHFNASGHKIFAKFLREKALTSPRAKL